jgi:hypothetical protein
MSTTGRALTRCRVHVEVATREAAEPGLVRVLADAGAHVVRLEPRATDLERSSWS